MAVFILGPGGDIFRSGDGTVGDDEVFGEGSTDYLYAGRGSDTLFGGEGSDWLHVDGTQPGDADHLFGGVGDDRLWLSFDALLGEIDGGTGTDTLYLSPGKVGIATRLALSEDFVIESNGVEIGNVRGIEAINFTGGSRKDDVQGGDLSDTLKGGGGDDTLLGGGGDDWIEVDAVAALNIDGGAGIDVLSMRIFNLQDDVLLQLGPVQRLVIGTLESVLVGMDRLEVYTAGGDDTVGGGQLDDFVSTYTGDDSVVSGDGNDSVWGGNGNDVIRLGRGDDFGDTGNGSDSLFGGAGNDSLNEYAFQSPDGDSTETYGGRGDDTISSHEGADRLFGGQGNDLIRARGNDTVYGGAGDDELSGGNGGAAVLFGDGGNDRVTVAATGEVADADGGDGYDVLVVYPNHFLPYTPISAGFVGGAYVVMSDGAVMLQATGFEAMEVIGAFNAGDTLVGGDGNDTLRGLSYSRSRNELDTDSLSGRNGNDLLLGMQGDDTLKGDRGDDTLEGGKGNDRLNGGQGVDVLIGGPGADMFAVDSFVLGQGEANRDEVRRFAQGLDRIDLSALDADVLTPGGSDVFDFIGDTDFTAAGQVRAVADAGAGTTTVTADMNGDGMADVMLVLTGVFTLTEADFLL